MKKLFCILLCLILTASLFSCRKANPTDNETKDGTTAPPVIAADPGTTPETKTEDLPQTSADTSADTTSAASKMDEGKAVALARDYLGETDPDSGYAYSYQFDSVTPEGN